MRKREINNYVQCKMSKPILKHYLWKCRRRLDQVEMIGRRTLRSCRCTLDDGKTIKLVTDFGLQDLI